MEQLDIKNLIEKAEQLVYDGKLDGAEQAKIPVQDIKIGEFQRFEISLVAERKTT